MTDIDKRLPDGIYFNLSFEAYLAQERISAGGITRMMEGPSSFWADSWMNPNKLEDEDTKAKLHGRAYHCARLEPEQFERRYVRDLVPEDLGPDALTNGTQIANRLAELGHPKSIKGEVGVHAQAARLGELDPNARIWHLERSIFERDLDGREPIDPKTWEEIERDARRLRMNPEIAALMSEGAAEVSILWTDPDSGLRCKIRPDYLGKDWITHLKTWDVRSIGKPSNIAIAENFRFNGHYRTGWFYLKGISAMHRLRVCQSDGTFMKKIPAEMAELAKAWQVEGKVWDVWYVFLRRSGIPDIRARKIMYLDLPAGVREQSIGASVDRFNTTHMAIARKADREISACLRMFIECREIFGDDGKPWFPRDIIGQIEDDDFSTFWLDSMDTPR